MSAATAPLSVLTRGSLPEKLTLYWHGRISQQFQSGNALVEEKGEPALQIRLNGKMSMIRLAKDGSMDFPADPKIASLLAGIFRSIVTCFL